MNTENDNEAFKDILNISDNLLLDSIMSESDSSMKSNSAVMNGKLIFFELCLFPGNQLNIFKFIVDTSLHCEPNVNNAASTKDELSDILVPNFSIESMVQETGT